MNIYEAIVTMQKQGQAGILITVVSKEGHGPQIPGAKLLVCGDGGKIGTIGGGALEHVAINEASALLKTKKLNVSKKYMLGEDSNVIDGIETGMICGGNITLFYEYPGVKDSVIIFGAGHVGKALSYYLKPFNYAITLIDSREKVLSEVEVEYVKKQFFENFNNIPFNKIITDDSYIVITTHSHELDYKILKSIHESTITPKYIGMIASKKKSEKMIERLSSEINKTIDFSRLYTPIGLKIGGTSPAEIALSIASEVQAIKYNQDGNKHARRVW